MVLVKKRDGTACSFDKNKIIEAIIKAQEAVGKEDAELAMELALVVSDELETGSHDTVDIEEIQDLVIKILQDSSKYEVATAYIRFRDSRERERRLRHARNESVNEKLNLKVINRKGFANDWDRNRLERFLCERAKLSQKISEDIASRVEVILSETSLEHISIPLLASLIDAAMVSSGNHSYIDSLATLRVESDKITRLMREGSTGDKLDTFISKYILNQLSFQSGFAPEPLRHISKGKLWCDGFDDLLRGSWIQINVEGREDNPWQIVAEAQIQANQALKLFKKVELVLPSLIIGHLEKGDKLMEEALNGIASESCVVYLYCDGQTPLLDDWQIINKNVGLAIYATDFLLQTKLQELGLPLKVDNDIMQQNKKVATKLAINAKGMDEDYSGLSSLAMSLVSMAKTRLQQLSRNSDKIGTEINYSIFGLSKQSKAIKYLEGELMQEALRSNITIYRENSLPEEACEHFGKAVF